MNDPGPPERVQRPGGCCGGPLDGKHALWADFVGSYEKVHGRNDYSKPIPGMYAHFRDEYRAFNTANRMATTFGRTSKRAGTKAVTAHVLFVHVDLLTAGSIPAGQR